MIAVKLFSDVEVVVRSRGKVVVTHRYTRSLGELRRVPVAAATICLVRRWPVHYGSGTPVFLTGLGGNVLPLCLAEPRKVLLALHIEDCEHDHMCRDHSTHPRQLLESGQYRSHPVESCSA